MLNPAGLLPHTGAMCLLDQVAWWDQSGVLCTARSHLDPANPLRRAGRLGIVCAAEYAMQAAAAHGALTSNERQAPGVVASLRDLRFGADRLDDPAHGTLSVRATLERREPAGSIYLLSVRREDGRNLLNGRALIITAKS